MLERANAVASAIVVILMVGPFPHHLQIDRHNQTVCDYACFNLARAAGGAAEVVGGTMQEQTRQALRNIETILKAAASSLDRVVKVTVLLVRPDLQRDERGISGVLPWGKTCANDG